METLRKCSRCGSSKLLEKYFSMNVKGEYMKTCDKCRKITAKNIQTRVQVACANACTNCYKEPHETKISEDANGHLYKRCDWCRRKEHMRTERFKESTSKDWIADMAASCEQLIRAARSADAMMSVGVLVSCVGLCWCRAVMLRPASSHRVTVIIIIITLLDPPQTQRGMGPPHLLHSPPQRRPPLPRLEPGSRITAPAASSRSSTSSTCGGCGEG